MMRSLRTLLVVLAGCSTLLVGLMSSSTYGRFLASSIHAFPGRLADTGREDDAGATSEESTEDETEEQEGREVHLLATVVLGGLTLEGRYVAGSETTCGKPRLQRVASPIRGPPTAG
jgi:hypothetical protein